MENKENWKKVEGTDDPTMMRLCVPGGWLYRPVYAETPIIYVPDVGEWSYRLREAIRILG